MRRFAWTGVVAVPIAVLALLSMAECGAQELTYIPPCTVKVGVDGVDPCEPNAPPIAFAEAALTTEPLLDTPVSMRAMLDGNPDTWVTHIVLRGLYMGKSSRCTSGDTFEPADYLADRIGSVEGSKAIKCYMDVHVRDNFVGGASVASSIPVMVLRYSYFEDQLAVGLSEGENVAERIEALRQRFQVDVATAFSGREHVLFLGPPLDVSSKAWRLLTYWDVQRGGDDVIAVHPNRDRWRAENPTGYTTHKASLEMSLADLKSKANDADDDRRDENGGRIGADTTLPLLQDNAYALDDYYTDVGASASAEPPPACGRYVPDPATDALLMLDCVVLLGLGDELSGERDLQWGVKNTRVTPISEWRGIRVEDGRVVALELNGDGLTGTVTAELADLTALKYLSLNNNQLTGPIPPELGTMPELLLLMLAYNSLTGSIPASIGNITTLDTIWLHHNELTGTVPADLAALPGLEELRLSGNRLTGCIPPSLREVDSNDLDDLGLPDCAV